MTESNVDDPIYEGSQHQERNSPLTDRDVLELAANEIKVDDLTDAERCEVLKDKKLVAKPYNRILVRSIPQGDFSALENIGNTEAFKILRKIGEQFAVFHEYTNADMDIQFAFSRGNLHESVHKQSGAFQNYARMMSVFSDVIENAVGIEAHSERYANTESLVDSVYVFVSAFNTENGTVPVLMEVKSFRDGTQNTLYVAVSLHEIERSRIIGITYTDNSDDAPIPLPASEYKIADIFKNVNTSEAKLIKYIPDDFLDAAQLDAKAKALAEQAEYIAKKNAHRYSGAEPQYQARTSPLTDRDVLELAANEIKVDDLTEGEQSALQIFKNRLTALQELQEQRTEQGRLYRQQQFGPNVDRIEAEKTLNRMKVLDDQIKKDAEAVLDVEKKEVLSRVLKKARNHI